MSLVDAMLLDAHRFNVWLAIRTDPNRGSGTLTDPYRANTADEFDALMNSFPAYTRVHLGPTQAGQEFKTRGYADGVSGGFLPKAGMKIVGSGVDVSTLKLVPNTPYAATQYFAIGHPWTTGSPPTALLLDYVEVSDLTIDCALPNPGSANVAFGGIRLFGNYVKVRRVKVKGWGTNTDLRDGWGIAVLTAAQWPISVGALYPGIEECIAVEPFERATAPFGLRTGHGTVRGRATNCVRDRELWKRRLHPQLLCGLRVARSRRAISRDRHGLVQGRNRGGQSGAQHRVVPIAGRAFTSPAARPRSGPSRSTPTRVTAWSTRRARPRC